MPVETHETIIQVKVKGITEAEKALVDLAQKIKNTTEFIAEAQAKLSLATNLKEQKEFTKEVEHHTKNLVKQNAEYDRQTAELAKLVEKHDALVEQFKAEEELANTVTKRLKELRAAIQLARETGAPLVQVPLSVQKPPAGSELGEQPKTLALKEAVELEQQMVVLTNQEKQTRKDTVGVINAENIAEEGSLNRLRQQQAILNQIIANKPKGFTTAVFEGEERSEQFILDKVIQINQQISEERNRIGQVTGEIKVQETELQRIILQRKQLNALVEQERSRRAGGLPDENIQFGNITLTLEEANRLLLEQTAHINRITEINKINKNILDQTNAAQEGSLTRLQQQKRELDQILASREKLAGAAVFEGAPITIQGVIDKLKEVNVLINKREQEIKEATSVEVEAETKYQELLRRRTELLELVRSRQLEILRGTTSVFGPDIQFEGVGRSLRGSEELLKRMTEDINKINQLYQLGKTFIDSNNAAERGSLAILQQEREQLELILRNRQIGATTVETPRGAQQVTDVLKRITELTEAERIYQQVLKNRQLALQASNSSIEGTEALIKLLTNSLKQLGTSLTQVQFNEMKANLDALVPGFNNFTVFEARAGDVAKFLQAQLAAANAQLDILRGKVATPPNIEFTKGIAQSLRASGLGSILLEERAKLQQVFATQAADLQKLATQYSAFSVKAGDSFESVKRKILELAAVQDKTRQQLQNINTAMVNTGTIGRRMTDSLSIGFDNLSKRIAGTLSIYFGFQAAISGISKIITLNKELSDSFADLQRIMGATRQETEKVIEGLRNIDTRTSLPTLVNFAEIASRAGVAANELAGVTEAINKLQLTAGEELGNVDQAVTSIVKLINIFKGTGQVTKDNILEMSNALLTLANQSVATGGFLINFADRLSGIQGISKIGISSVLGLASAFENTGATAEVAATSISQILLRVGIDVQKYAALANNVKQIDLTEGMLEGFRNLLRTNPAEALIQLAEGLVANGEALDQVGGQFGDLAAKGVRVTTIFGSIAERSAFFREQIQLANSALQDQSTILEGAAAKEETFGAVMDKIGAKITLAFSNKELQEALFRLGSGILAFVQLLLKIPFKAVEIGLIALSGALLQWQLRLVASSAAQKLATEGALLGNLANKASSLGLGIKSAAERRAAAAAELNAKAERDLVRAVDAETAALARKAELDALIARGNATKLEMKEAEVALRVANKRAIDAEAQAELSANAVTKGFLLGAKFSPLGILFTALTIATTLFTLFGDKVADTTEKLFAFNTEAENTAQFQKEVAEAVAKSADEQIGNIGALVAILHEKDLDDNARLVIARELIKANANFADTLDEQGRVFTDVSKAEDKYNKATEKIQGQLKLTAEVVKNSTQPFDRRTKALGELQAKHIALGFTLTQQTKDFTALDRSMEVYDQQVDQESSKVIGLTAILESNTASVKDKIKAQEDLIKISPEFREIHVQDGEAIDLSTEALKKNTIQLLENAKAKATGGLFRERVAEAARATLKVTELEKAIQNVIIQKKLTAEDIKLAKIAAEDDIVNKGLQKFFGTLNDDQQALAKLYEELAEATQQSNVAQILRNAAGIVNAELVSDYTKGIKKHQANVDRLKEEVKTDKSKQAELTNEEKELKAQKDLFQFLTQTEYTDEAQNYKSLIDIAGLSLPLAKKLLEARLKLIDAKVKQNALDQTSVEESIKQGKNMGNKLDELEKDLQALETERAHIQKLLDILFPTIKGRIGGVEVETSEIDLLEALRSRLIAQENLRFAKLQEVHTKVEEEDEDHLKRRIAILENGQIVLRDLSAEEVAIEEAKEKELHALRVQVRETTLQENIQHLRNLQEINETVDLLEIEQLKEQHEKTLKLLEENGDALNAKEKAIFDRRHKIRIKQSAEEEKAIANLEEKITQSRVDTNKKIAALNEKEFNEQTRQEKKRLESRIAEFQEVFEKIAQVPNQTFSAIAAAQAKLDEQVFQATKESFDRQIALAQSLKQDTTNLLLDRNKLLAKANKDMLDNDRKIYEAYFKDIEKKLQEHILHVQAQFIELRNAALNQPAATPQIREGRLKIFDQLNEIIKISETLQEREFVLSKKQVDFDIVLTGQLEKTIAARDAAKKKLDDLFAAGASAVNRQAAQFEFDRLEALVKKQKQVTEADLDALKLNIQEIKEQFKKGLDDINFLTNQFGSGIQGVSSFINKLFFKITDKDIDDAAKKGTAGFQKLLEKIRLNQKGAGIVAETLADAYTATLDIMNAFYDAEQERIQHSNELAKERIDIEFEQRKAQAQSQAERESLDREAAAEKKKIDRESGEQFKKIKLAEAKIALATTLMNIAAAAAGNPLNSVTAGLAGQIQFAILSAAAFAQYQFAVGVINSATFALGGYIKTLGAYTKGMMAMGGVIYSLTGHHPARPLFASGGEVPLRGGRFGGKQHSQGGTRFMFRDSVYEAEVDELAVIRTRNAPKGKRYEISGTHEQIASALNSLGGGVQFKPGADIRRLAYGSNITRFDFGSTSPIFTLKPPANPSAFLGVNTFESDKFRTAMIELGRRVDQQTENINNLALQTNERIDKIKVQVVAKEVTTTDRLTKRASAIGTI